MRELVIVIADLYLPEAAQAPAAARSDGAVAGLDRLARFGRREALERDWRDWLARWLGREGLAGTAPAVVAAAAIAVPERSTAAWVATPVHLLTSMTGVHMDRRSILRLDAAEAVRLADDFGRVFADSGYRLEPTGSGALLLLGPAPVGEVITTEPARALIGEVADALPRGSGASALKRLGAEFEMWLYEHPVNVARLGRGDLPVSTLWLWGGGIVGSGPVEVAAASRDTIAFGDDVFLRGLWRAQDAQGEAAQSLPGQLSDLFGYPHARRAALVTEVASMLHLNPQWTLLDALADLDRRYISPAVEALHSGRIGALWLLANDRRVLLRPRDRLKIWRRPRTGIEGLS